ncbi:MAG: 50S ribosomal protein L23 [Deltaproteobacteria bacterium]|nr:50S ribosomal protein L23 [Deltaproteobacteria bacterium]MBW2649635.1 50S ribosomal protein L23 [Deltaproteobacteria bacterium]
MDIYSVIKKPLVTEKSTIARDEENKYFFEVDRVATKIEIRNAVEKIFKVKVVNIHTINVTGKKKRVGRITGRKRSWKKAVITLAPGSSIEVYEGV